MSAPDGPQVSRRRLLAGAGVLGASALTLTGTETAAASTASLSDRSPAGRGKVREYWLAAAPLPTNVVPTGRDEMMGTTFTAADTTYVALGYRAYTPQWGTPLPGSSELGPNTGLPGPVLRGEVGDTIIVHFRNDDTHYQQPHSIHPHGVRYTPASDGARTAADPHKPGTAVPPGATYTYDVLPSSVGTWPYHDHSTPFRIPGPRTNGTSGGGMSMGEDTPTMEIGAQLGLIGMLVLTEPGETRPDREFYLILHDLYAADIPSLNQDYDCFNGRAYLGNTPTFRAAAGQRVRWHVIALGTEFHVFHVHGHRWRAESGRYTDSVPLGPAMTTVADWVEDNPGEWLYHCHVVDHMQGGMIGRYTVEP
jgi:FtsP/CotA-like multicopper oxidase with cupredoxin domain